MTERRPPVVVRERISRLTGSRIATALVFDRDFMPEEQATFLRLAHEAKPEPGDFEISGRMVRYECEREEAERWRLAVEIYGEGLPPGRNLPVQSFQRRVSRKGRFSQTAFGIEEVDGSNVHFEISGGA